MIGVISLPKETRRTFRREIPLDQVCARSYRALRDGSFGVWAVPGTSCQATIAPSLRGENPSQTFHLRAIQLWAKLSWPVGPKTRRHSRSRFRQTSKLQKAIRPSKRLTVILALMLATPQPGRLELAALTGRHRTRNQAEAILKQAGDSSQDHRHSLGHRGVLDYSERKGLNSSRISRANASGCSSAAK
jgi:hypothetical protein